MLVRAEQSGDREQVDQLHAAAFGASGEAVAALVQALRHSLADEPGLSLVACEGDVIVGHALFSRNLLDAPPRLVDVQVLSPLAVRPDRQGRGVGSQLVTEGAAVLADRGVPAVFLEGSPTYYARLGFLPAGERSFRKPSLRIPDPAFQVRLLPAYEPWMTGTLVYRQDFWDHDLVGLRG